MTGYLRNMGVSISEEKLVIYQRRFAQQHSGGLHASWDII